jgi:hypothetical protein
VIGNLRTPFRCALLISSSLLLLFSPASRAQRESFNTYTPDIPMTYTEMSKRFDFAFFVEAEPVTNFMNYKGSRFASITKVTLSFRQYSKPGRPCNTDLLKFKELYYSGNSLIGAHQFQQVQIRRGSTGAIRLVNCDKFDELVHPIVGGMVRSFQEMNLAGALMGLVLCPQNQYMNVVAAMPDYQFVPLVDTLGTNLAKTSGSKQAALQLHFWSEPRCKAFEKSYCFIAPSSQFAN